MNAKAGIQAMPHQAIVVTFVQQIAKAANQQVSAVFACLDTIEILKSAKNVQVHEPPLLITCAQVVSLSIH